MTSVHADSTCNSAVAGGSGAGAAQKASSNVTVQQKRLNKTQPSDVKMDPGEVVSLLMLC